MKVSRSPYSGFCQGITCAVQKALNLKKEGYTVYTEGLLTHNPEVISLLEKEGIHVLSPKNLPTLLASPRPCILIRAHGIPQERRQELHALGVPLFDATCSHVGHVVGRVKQLVKKNYFILFFGDPFHAETRGILSYAPESSLAVKTLEDFNEKRVLIEKYVAKFSHFALLAQTTSDLKKWEQFKKAVQEYFPEVEILETICEATRCRQSELQKQLENPDFDAVVILGGKISSNTTKLYEMAVASGKTVFFVETLAELLALDLRKYHQILLAAGASTMPESLERAEEILRNKS